MAPTNSFPAAVKAFTLAPTFLFLLACASGYGEFYKSAAGATPEAIAKVRVAPPPKAPALEHGPARPSDVMAYYARQGYALIGYSSFNSGHRQSDGAAVSQGAKVGADLVVVIDPKYTGSRTANIPITTPTATTSYTSGTATAFGTGGTATAYGNSTTTTYGSQTTFVPMTVQRFDYGALYFVKRHYVLGANYRDLNDKERQTLQTNKGVYVLSIVDGSAAYRGDLLVGDMILAIDGQPIAGSSGFNDALQQKRGRPVELSIVRGDKTITKSLTLGN